MKDKIDIERMKKEGIFVNCKTKQQFNNIIKLFNEDTKHYRWRFKEYTYLRYNGCFLVYGNINWLDNEDDICTYEELLIKPCNINFRRQIINKFFENGKIATIHFKKKNGENRVMNCRIKKVKEEFRKSNNKKSSKETMTFWEISKQQYRSVRLDSIISIKGRKEKIYFESI